MGSFSNTTNKGEWFDQLNLFFNAGYCELTSVFFSSGTEYFHELFVTSNIAVFDD